MSQPAADKVNGYPAEWESSARTLDGALYGIRPIRPDDLQRERDFLVGMSPESRYLRMMYSMREPTPALLARFVNVDYERDMAFVAVTGAGSEERIIGVARYATDAQGNCEFAVAVSDVWQGRGVGAALTRTLFDYARRHGIHKLHGDILVSNDRMIEFVHWLGMETHRAPEDATLLEATREL